MKPNNLQMIGHLSHHFGMPMHQVIEVLKMPTHPRELRDEFAMAALPWVLEAHPSTTFARGAYGIADAMLAARTAQVAPEPAPAADPVPANTAQWYAELLELLGATCQTDAKHLINELTAAKIDEAEASSLMALYRALGVRDQEAALAKIKELITGLSLTATSNTINTEPK